MKDFLFLLIDSCYFLFKRFMPLKTYRYAVCGGGNLVLDIILYFLCFHFLLGKQNLDLYFVVLSPHIGSLFLVFPITFSIGFLLNKFIVFSESNLSATTQFWRYSAVAIINLLMNYFSMKLLVEILHIYPTPSKILTTVISVLFSYIMQNKFSFKVK